ncbi:MAG: hypothetical protein RIB32_03910 [Phycisphaerales bacterium]
MNLHISRDRARLAALMGGADLDFAADRVVLPHPLTPGADVFACELDANPLSDAGVLIDLEAPAPRTILWSGQPMDADDPDNWFRRTPATWGEAAQQRFNAFCAELAPQLQRAGRRILFRTHARHVLCDPPRCLKMLEQWGGTSDAAAFGIAFDPVSLLEPDMLPHADDHLDRLFRFLGPVADALYLGNAHIDDDRVIPAPLHDGPLDPDRLLALAREHLPPQTPVILGEAELDAQLARI